MFPRSWSGPSVPHRLLPVAWAVIAVALLLAAGVIVLLGMTTDPSMGGAQAQDLLGPFRWTPLSQRGLA
jgi:hypothetical protein